MNTKKFKHERMTNAFSLHHQPLLQVIILQVK